jgi:intracellular sulfur oxidation DsrE/DsrF family protein
MKRVLFLGAGAAVTGATSLPAFARQVPGGSQLVERRAEFDRRAFDTIVARRAVVRQVWDNVALRPTVLNNIKNTLNGLVFGFGYRPDEVAIALVNHSGSAAYTYNDAIWAKYRIADFLHVQGRDGEPERKNPYYGASGRLSPDADPDDERGFYQDVSLQTLQMRGAILLTCHTAVQEQARTLVRNGYAPAGTSSVDVADDILTNLVPGAVVVPSGVATLAVLQQHYQYSYVTVQS